MMKLGTWVGQSILAVTAMCIGAVATATAVLADETGQSTAPPPNLVGTWQGDNKTISDLKGLRSWKKTIQITEQTDRRFRGHFTYSAGTKSFFGIIYPDNVTISWVASDSRGYNQGKILGPDRLAACYIESGIDATAGCSDLKRTSKTPKAKAANTK